MSNPTSNLRDTEALLDIAKAGNLIAQFIWGMDQTRFNADAKTQSAVSHQLLIVGEATRRLTNEFRSKHGHIPWPLITGMRNQLIHAYDAVDLGEVWQTSTIDIPALLIEINVILNEN